MGGLEKIDADLMMRLQDNMFTFENLNAVDNKGIQVLMRSVDNNQLMIAMKGASDEVKARFFDNMSERARRHVQRRDGRQRPHALVGCGRSPETNHALLHANFLTRVSWS